MMKFQPCRRAKGGCLRHRYRGASELNSQRNLPQTAKPRASAKRIAISQEK
jgi:hypothetical protein